MDSLAIHPGTGSMSLTLSAITLALLLCSEIYNSLDSITLKGNFANMSKYRTNESKQRESGLYLYFATLTQLLDWNKLLNGDLSHLSADATSIIYRTLMAENNNNQPTKSVRALAPSGGNSHFLHYA